MGNHTVTTIGFTLTYCAVMVGIAILTMPYIEGWRHSISLYLLLPCGLIGAAVMLYGCLRADWVHISR